MMMATYAVKTQEEARKIKAAIAAVALACSERDTSRDAVAIIADIERQAKDRPWNKGPRGSQ
jgi:hypothetical protein